MILPMIVRSGVDPVALLGAAAGDAEAGDHLVEDEQRAGLRRRAARRSSQEAGLGRDHAHVGRHRLEPGSPRADRSVSRRAASRRVPGHDHGRGGGGLGDARARRDALRGQARAGLRRAGRRRGRGRRRRTSGSCSRPVTARARRIALIVASVPDEVIRTISTDGIRRDHLGGQLDLALGGRAEAGAPGGRLACTRRDDLGVRRDRGSADPRSRPSRCTRCRRRR